MINEIGTSIAGVRFHIKCRESITLHDLPALYAPFLKKIAPDSETINITITRDMEHIPQLKYFSKIFDSDDAWSMYRRDDEYLIALMQPGTENKPTFLAYTRHDFKEITIYCSEKLIQTLNGKTAVLNPVCYPLNQILLMYYLAQREGALIHAAGLCFNDKGYIFPGKSGAGKSTISRHLAGINDYEFISDDRIVLRKINKTFKVFGTPWPGEAGIAVNKSVDLAGIFFLSQASFNRIEEIKPQQAMERLFPVVSIPWYDKEVMLKILDFCEDLVSNVTAYELHFKPGNEIRDVFKNLVSK
jgi:hypothetical protein